MKKPWFGARGAGLLIFVAACGPNEARETAAAPTETRAVSCTGTVAEYCARFGGDCATYEERLVQLETACSQPTPIRMSSAHCVGLYRSLSRWEPMLGGRDEYFDGGGRLFAAFAATDYHAYCGGTSFLQSWGTPPSCPSAVIITDACAQ